MGASVGTEAAAGTSSRQRRGSPAAAPTAAPPQAAPHAAAGNPSQYVDLGLGLVVIAFHDTAGAVTSTLPTAQQLQAYRRWQDRQAGPPSAGGLPPGMAPPPSLVPSPSGIGMADPTAALQAQPNPTPATPGAGAPLPSQTSQTGSPPRRIAGSRPA